MDVGEPDVLARLLAFMLDLLSQLVAGFDHHLLDAGRVDAPVAEEALQGRPGDLATHRVEGAQHDRLGGVVDDDVDAGRRFQRADIAALAPDDAALELVRRQVDDRDRRLAALLGGLALHGSDENLAAAFGGLVADLGLGLPDALGDLRDEVAFDAAHDLDAGLLLGERGDALELPGDQGALLLDGLTQGLELGFSTGQPLLVGVELAQPPLEALLALIGPLLEPRDLRSPLTDLRLGLVAAPCRLLLRGEEHRLRLLLGRADLLETAFGVRIVRTRLSATVLRAYRTATTANAAATITSPARARISMPIGWNLGVGRDAPCLDCLTPRRDRGETHSVSMIRSGPARVWPVVHDGRPFHCTSQRGHSHVSMNDTWPGYP